MSRLTFSSSSVSRTLVSFALNQFLIALQVIECRLNRRSGPLKLLGQFFLEPQPLISFRFLHEGQQFLGFTRSLFSSLFRQTRGGHVVA